MFGDVRTVRPFHAVVVMSNNPLSESEQTCRLIIGRPKQRIYCPMLTPIGYHDLDGVRYVLPHLLLTRRQADMCRKALGLCTFSLAWDAFSGSGSIIL